MSARPRLIPSPGDLADLADEMLLLNGTIANQARRFEAFASGDESIDPFDILKEVPGVVEERREESPPIIEERRGALVSRLRGIDYHDPHGWPQEIADALRAERKALCEPEAFNLLAGMTIEEDDSGGHVDDIATRFAMPPAVAGAIAERGERARLLGEAAGLIETPEATAETPAAPPIDFATIASELRRAGKKRSALLVEHMSDKSESTYHSIAKPVHETTVSDEAIESNIKRTNRSLEEMGVPLRFKVASMRVYRVLPTE